MDKERLKLGLLIDSFEVPAWAYYSIEKIVNSDFAEILLVILNDDSSGYTSRIVKYWNNRNYLVYTILSKIDEVLFRREPDAFTTKNLEGLLRYVPSIKVKPIHKEYSDYFQLTDIENIKDYKLDILIRMGFRVLRGDILDSSRYGIWSHHHGDNRVNKGGPPVFWETLENLPETGVILQILNEDLCGGKVLHRSWYPRYELSPYLNRNLCFWASSALLSRQIECLQRLGEERFFEEIEKFNQEFDLYSHRLYKTPQNITAIPLMAKYMTRLLAKTILKIYNKMFRFNQWYLMFDLERDIGTSLYRFKKIVPPKDRYWADPHVIQNNHNYYIFIEEYIYKNKKGHISVIEMDEHGNFKEPVPVLEKDYLLSYPFVFQWEGKHYMVPETRDNRTVELYECTDFPHVWEFRMNLMENINAFDATLLHRDEKWWLFTGMYEHEGVGHSSELYIFYSNELFSNKWTPHPLNPVISDIKRARPAGRIFVRNGKIYRPSQDCSVMYGYGFNINEIERLSETEYAERQIISVKPDWDKGVKGTHTFTHEGRLTIIDACKTRHKLLHF